MSLETTRERKDKGGDRGEKKKGLLALMIFILPTLEIVSERQKSARDTPLGHLNRAVPFLKIRVYIGMKEKGGERGEKKKGLLALMIFILPTLEIVSRTTKKCSRHTARAPQPSGTVFKNPGIYWHEMG